MQNIRVKNQDVILDNCDFVKAMLMIFIVLHHSMLFWGGAWFTGNPVTLVPALGMFAKWIRSFSLHAFVLVSGYIFFFVKQEKGRYQTFSELVKSKAKRLILPYIAFSLFWAIPAQYFFTEDNLPAIINNYALAVSPAQLWFLIMLFATTCIFWPIADFCQNKTWSSAVLMLLLNGIGMIGNRMLPNVFQIWSALEYLLIFWLGFKLRQYGLTRLAKIPSIAYAAAHVFLFTMIECLPSEGSMIMKLFEKVACFGLDVIGAVASFMVIQSIASLVRWKENKICLQLVRYSMPIYLLHQQIVYVFIVLLNGCINPYLHVMINFSGAIVLAMAISSVLVKFKPTRVVLGIKN